MSGQTFESLCRAGLLEVGDGYRAKNNELGGTGPIFLRSAYLQDNGFMLANPERFISNQTVPFGQKLSQLGDVVITTKGNSTGRVGRIRLTEAGAVYSPHLSYWRSRSPAYIDQAFLYYWAASEEFRRQLSGMAHSTDMAPYLSLRDQARLKISLPEISRQVGIGGILSALDDKIELNRRMNETLEASARALFRDWFVDFGPTRAKTESRPAYLDPDLWSLFPNRFDDQGKPEGWKLSPISKFCDSITNGGTPKRDNHLFWQPPEVPWLTSGEVRHPYIIDTIQWISQLGLNESSAKWVPPRSTVVALYGATAGEIALVGEQVTTNQAICALVPKCDYEEFNYLALNSSKSAIVNMARGSAQQNLSRGIIQDFPVIEPSEGVVSSFSRYVSPLFEKIFSFERESRTLAETRDTLLPKLMSGAIRVREAESAVAALC